ncbi:MAG: phosphoribosyltransferase [Clostridia bacterium]|nr:phosphoribosyltransferase [Clostridia bacterium]
MNREIRSISWSEYDELIRKILEQVADKEIDILVPILRGGSIIGLSLASNMQIPTKYMRIERSKSNLPNCEFGEAKISKEFDLSEIEGKSILICDDVVDSGETIKAAMSYLKQFQPKNVYVAALFGYEDTNDGYIVGEMLNEHKWLEFPWERILR